MRLSNSNVQFSQPNYLPVEFLIILTIIGLLALLLDLIGAGYFWHSAIQGAVNPLREWSYQLQTDIEAFPGAIENNEIIRQRNADLEERVLNLEQLVAEQSRLAEENQQLRQTLELELPERELFNANVIGLNLQDSNMNIDVGRSSGVEDNDVVIWGNSVVGLIANTREYSATIQLLQDPELLVPVQSGTQRLGLAQFVDGQLIISEAVTVEGLAIGDRVVTAIQDEVFPAGLFVGKVSRIENDPRAALQTITIDYEVNYKNLGEVIVVESPINSVEEGAQ